MVIGGCAGQRAGHNHYYCLADDAPVDLETAVIERDTISAELADVPSYEMVTATLAQRPVPVEYQVLDPAQCQCLAATNAVLANQIEAERRLAAMSRGGFSQARRRAIDLQMGLLNIRTVEDRNKAAAAALELFYRLAEAESNRDLSRRSIAEIDQLIANIEQLDVRGLQHGADRYAVAQQKLDALARDAQVRASIRQLDGQLQQLLGLDEHSPMSLWPMVDLTVNLAAVDVEAAVAEGMANRTDLRVLCLLIRTLDRQSLPAVRRAMSQIDAALGSGSAAQSKLLAVARRDCELPVRQRQLNELLAAQRRQASEEIRQAADAIENRLKQVALAKEKLVNRRQQLQWLEHKRDADGVTAFDIGAAKLKQIEAESELVHQVVEWKIAQVKLKQVQGLLASECGYCVSQACCESCR